ncbi:uncharacterized protein LOC108595224 [Drosophila busckii]|uniref:uncharacterized protein LOC117134660 n=1 Tax=Drosophila busckii TaxID=30019 RepID=UPI001432DB81|nr:uncharacterized protein LOC117134660 [Drosophila busckii]XP_033148937.1 uncharacterized protein LOC108595224 [Drosophila busckii]
MRLTLGVGAAQLLLLITFCGTLTVGAGGVPPLITGAVDIIKLIQGVTTGILKVWDLIGYLPTNGNDLPIVENRQHQIIEQISLISDQIDRSEKQQEEYFKLTIESMKKELHAESQLAHQMHIVSDLTKLITMRYDQMNSYKDATIEPITFYGFVEWNVVPGPTALPFLLRRLHEEMYGDVKEDSSNSLFALLVRNYENEVDQICSSNRSPQQFAYDLFTKAALTELKVYLTAQFSWIALRNAGRGNFTKELSLMQESYDKNLQHSQKLLIDVMVRTGRVYWRCDPKPDAQVLGRSYEQVTRLLQGYIENEVNLNAEQSCTQTCEDYDNVRITGCYPDTFCNKQPKCSGRLYNCRFIEADMSICMSKNSSRRYDYVEYDNGRVIGADAGTHGTQCPGPKQEADSWSYWFWRCNYCLCLCDDEESAVSDRYFSLRDTLSDFRLNMIVTGARFIKDQRVFHLQLQQGELLPGGLVNQSSLAWIPLESFDVSHVDVREGFDYHKLSYKSRAVDLDEISTTNSSLVVTGARLRVLKNHLNLEVRFSLFNVTTGRLMLPEKHSVWLSNDKEHTQLILKNPHIPTKSMLSSMPLSKHNEFMEFVSSSTDKDAAQNTVPYIDVQDVVPNPAVALSGLGIYHKGRNGYGGFFAPKIITYDLSKTITKPTQLNMYF